MSLTTMTIPAVFSFGDVVERFPSHTAGEGTVADQGDHCAVGDPLQFIGPGQAVGVGQGGGGMRVLNKVMLRLGAGRVSGKTALFPQFGEVFSTGQDLMDVRLVAVSNRMGSRGESNTRCKAMVSSTTPRLGPR